MKKNIIRVALGAVLLLLVPLLGRWDWGYGDFIVMFVLLFGAGLTFVLLTTKIADTKRRVIAGVVVALAFLYIWAELSVGIFTNWGS